MKNPVFALIDCNNFFVSCERVFRPDLATKPVAVLSSNDGCVVARSNEVKALGIPMAAPAFKYREIFDRHGIVKFSANFELYGNMSRRITELLTTITPRIEVYSVDESFLDLSQLDIRDHTAWGHKVRESILQWTGLPVSIGIAPSKSLAKLASDRGKKVPALDGVLSLMGNPETDWHLSQVPVGDVWGIGWRLAPKMRAEGAGTALHLAQLSPQRAQQLMGIRGRQLVAELNGISCFPLDLEHQKPKSILRSRTFGEDTSLASVIEAALASFATTAAFRLRRSSQLARRAGIFLDTNKHKPGFRRWSREVIYQVPTADTGQLISDTINLFSQIYSPRMSYHRAGVWLGDFRPADYLQTDLLGAIDPAKHDRAQARMQAVDVLNERFGKRTIRYATEDLAQKWQPRHHTRSPRYTTRPDELPTAKIVP
ncbi:MAG TPA: Y-family DNA polymerase [Candidatus Limnocylindria bacterium]|nr:Y-family DNA polymerase [Candidatus Limnocylindria bacterium]